MTHQGSISIASEAEAAAPMDVYRPCPNCGTKFLAGQQTGSVFNAAGRGLGKDFCRKECRVAFNNRAKAEGAVIITLLKVQTRHRHAKPGSEEARICAEARREYTEIVQMMIDADDEAGRPDPAAYVDRMLKQTRYIDRTRKF